MICAAYVAWILLCESCKFGEKTCYSNWEFFLRDCIFIGAPRTEPMPYARSLSQTQCYKYFYALELLVP